MAKSKLAIIAPMEGVSKADYTKLEQDVLKKLAENDQMGPSEGSEDMYEVVSAYVENFTEGLASMVRILDVLKDVDYVYYTEDADNSVTLKEVHKATFRLTQPPAIQ